VGGFGWLDVRCQAAFVVAVGAGGAALVGGALLLGTWRDRLVLGSVMVSLIVLVIGLQVLTQMPFGFGAQARYVMPMSAGALVLAGRTIDAGLDLRARNRTWERGRVS